MARIRTFIGIEPSKQVRDRLVALQENFARFDKEVKWVEPENLHVTLLFLGEVNDRDLLDVCRAVSTVTREFPAFRMSIEKTGCFPNLRRPRVLWAGVEEGQAEVMALHGALEQPLFDLGCYRREERIYTPHVTLGRIKGDSPVEPLTEGLTRYQKWQGGVTNVQEVHVLSSELTSAGPQYAILSRAKLTAELEPDL